MLNNFPLNNNLIAMTQDQLDQLVKQTITKALTAHQSNVNSESSGSSELQEESGQDGVDE